MLLLEKMKEASALGIFSKTTDSAFVEAAGYAGLDFIILDMEHGPISLEHLHNHVRAAEISNMASIVRVPQVDANAIGSALDAGASGVQIPNINNAQQARDAVNAARFYPKGGRGVCRFVRAAHYGTQDKSQYFQQANSKMVILQVEGVEGVENLDEILAVEGFDILFVGPYDLSQSVGKPGEVNAPEVLSLIGDIAANANEKSILLGAFCDTPENAKTLRDAGFSYIAYSVDVNIFAEAIKQLI